MDLITELPFGLRGRVFRSAMPYSLIDTAGEILSRYQQVDVDTVVLLVSDDEAERKSGQNLRDIYTNLHLAVIYLPIPDFDVPDIEALRAAIRQAVLAAQQGHTLVVHCAAGIGRTGTFLACMAKVVFGIDGEKAIAWVRNYIPGAVEVPTQFEMILKF